MKSQGQPATEGGRVVLQRAAMRMILAPGQGGGIRKLTWHGEDLLRPTPVGAGSDPFDLACFAMVPYANRIAHGSFHFAGRDVRLAPNWSGDRHPLHGQGWLAPWSVVAQSPASATLAFEGGADSWPWRYRSEQRFELKEDALSLELSVENLSPEPMPAMLGFHPYFPDAAHARLEALVPRVWLTDPDALPLKEIPTPAGWGFMPGRALQRLPLDHCFAGWNGTAVLRWPGRMLRVSAPGCRFLHVYVPSGRDFFCIEPQSAAAGALGRAAEAQAVAPGERCAIRVHLAVGRA